MLSTETGKLAEEKTASFLAAIGYQIIDMNWRTRTCEIDIVAYKDNLVYFVEVKYRSNFAHGTGFEYITRAKLKRMEYAAHLWTVKHRWKYSYCLSAASVFGQNYEVDFIQQLQIA